MADDNKKHEPQSYGSQGEWTRRDDGGTVTPQKGPPNGQQAGFYESRVDREDTSPGEGGFTSPVQVNDVEHAPWHGTAASEEAPDRKVTGQPSGAKRGGYFRERDYK